MKLIRNNAIVLIVAGLGLFILDLWHFNREILRVGGYLFCIGLGIASFLASWRSLPQNFSHLSRVAVSMLMALCLCGLGSIWIVVQQGDKMNHFMIDRMRSELPFSFRYAGVPSATCLDKWSRQQESATLDDGQSLETTTWTEKTSGLRVICTMTRFKDFPAAELLVRFQNNGKNDTAIISDVKAIDLVLPRPVADGTFRLHKVNGAPANPTDFEPKTVVLNAGATAVLSGGNGRSSKKDFPFFRVDTGEGTLIVAVGWSGQWQATLNCYRPGDKDAETRATPGQAVLRLAAGLETTSFRLRPGESVRGPRILVLFHEGDPELSHSVFRRLILRHYVSRAHGPGSISYQPVAAGSGKGTTEPRPVLFCNTCFTRKGHWLNQCNESNQIALLRAMAPLGVQAIITDAGWFKGGWPSGAGNWDYDPGKYPHGMGAVSAAARECGMLYGLWFEPERVVPGTSLDREHAPWVLRLKGANPGWGSLLDFGVPEVRKFFFAIVEQYLQLPGLKVYRQDFNMDPLPFWRDNDAPDRQGIHEMRYMEGLYAYWDMIRAAHPGIFMEECASGGQRIDLETITRFQVHQKSDYWFDNLVDQASLFALSAYLPNIAISVPVDRLDNYSFHSAMASSLIIGWIADAPGFDMARARQITDTYRAVRHLLNGDWYGLTPWSRDQEHWLVSQYHRGDLGEGMILAFRRDKCESRLAVQLKGLIPSARYELRSTVTGQAREITGEKMMRNLELLIPQAPGSDLLVYRRL